jgi:hypothetical protein
METGSRMEDGTMARRRGKMEGEDRRQGAAVERYRAAFGADALPCLAAVTEEAVPVAVALLDHAVAAGRPMRHGRVAAALGEEGAPMGGCI